MFFLCRLPTRALRLPSLGSSTYCSWTTRPLSRYAIRQNFRVPQQKVSRIPSFREQVARSKEQPSFTDKVGKPKATRQILFVVAGTTLLFSYAAFRTNLDTGIWIKRLSPSVADSWLSHTLTSVDLKRAQNAEVIKKLREWYAYIGNQASDVPSLLRPWLAAAYVWMLQPYADASEGKRLCWKICLFNAAIWLVWKVPRFQLSMMSGFTHNPLSGLSYTLLTSMFSHRSFIHLAANCLALESFGSAAYFYLVREQDKAVPVQLESTAAWHFMAFFISAGLFSSLVSHVIQAKVIYPRLVAQLASPTAMAPKIETWASAVASTAVPASQAAKAAATQDILPSLGASGAVYGAVAMTALAFPESEVALFIPPSYPINIQYGVGGLLLLDVIGALRGWRYFDHWAHIGGATFGAAYYAYGPNAWQNLRRFFGFSVIEEAAMS